MSRGPSPAGTPREGAAPQLGVLQGDRACASCARRDSVRDVTRVGLCAGVVVGLVDVEGVEDEVVLHVAGSLLCGLSRQTRGGERARRMLHTSRNRL